MVLIYTRTIFSSSSTHVYRLDFFAFGRCIYVRTAYQVGADHVALSPVLNIIMPSNIIFYTNAIKIHVTSLDFPICLPNNS